MKEPRYAHPELVAGPNPLLEGLAPFVPLSKLPAALRREPLANVDWRSLLPEQREALLVLSDEHYWPVTPHVQLAAEIQLLLRSGYVQRNPLSLEEQRRINVLALADSIERVQLQSLRRRASGSIVEAITGMGKSTAVDRVLSVVAPKQVIVHGKRKECGWSVLKQVAYLIVNAPANATRKGLFAAIVGALDALLGEDYAADLKRQKNLDEAMVFVAKLLSIHRVGLLVIDENQASTLAENVWGDEFILYFLGLMNLGIPVLLMGNPLAFSDLSTSAQLLRRFAMHGWHRLQPARRDVDPWWYDEFLPGATRFSLCEEVPPVDEVRAATSSIDGGIPGIFIAIWKEALKISLRRGGVSSQLVVEDLSAAACSPSVDKLLDVSRAVSIGNADASFTDLPDVAKVPEQGEAVGSNTADQGAIGAAMAKMARGLKQQESKQIKKKERDKALMKVMSEEDLRRTTDAFARFSGERVGQGELDV